MKLTRATLLCGGASALAWLVLPGAVSVAHAQAASAEPQPAPSQLSDIIVTASKRSLLISKTAIAVSALDAQALADDGVVELRNLNASAPNVHIKTVALANSIQVTIRGISNTDFNTGGQPAIATYVDGVLVPRTQGLNGALYDIERVEILRGPQGTLYGRNATAGNINVITAGPKSDFHSAASISYGNYNEINGNLMVNLPISDTLAVRLAGSFRRNDGLYQTAKNHPRGESARNYGMAEDYAGRFSLLWTPTDRFSWRLTAEHLNANGTPGTEFETGPDGRPSDGRDPFSNPFVTGAVAPERSIRNTMIRSRMAYDLSDGLTVSYVAGYQNLRHSAQLELAGAPVSFIDTIRAARTKNQYHEVNLTYDPGAFYNVLGANYAYEEEGTINPGHFGPAGSKVSIAFGSGNRIDYEDRSYGVFDQLTYRVSDVLRLTGGVRYSYERAKKFGLARNYTCPVTFTYAQLLDAALLDTTPPGCAGNSSVPNAGSWSKVTWRAGVEYDLSPGTMAYANASTGFKSGGLNGLVTGLPPSFAPETTANYEAGLKTRIGGRARINTAAFYTVYKDLQVVQFVGSPVARQTTTNAGRAEIYGIEIEGEVQLTDNDVISGFANYLHARYDRYQNAVDPFPAAHIVPSLKGNSLANAPDWSFRAEYKHIFNLANGGTLTPNASVYWQSRSYLREFNLPIDRVGAYSLVDLNLTYADPTGRWMAQAYVHNAGDKLYRNGASVIGRYFSDYDEPRRYGVRISFEY